MFRRLNQPQFRPPAEADSLILQIDQGCPYNRCTFCGMYRGVPYQRRTREEIAGMVKAEARHQPDVRRIFLADGDVMSRPAEELQSILRLLAESFPDLARVNAYAAGRSILGKTEAELRALRDLKLQTLYMGLESGDDRTLQQVHKAETSEMMVEAGLRAQAAGLRMSVMILLGLGGRAGTAQHASATAAALNRMQPRLLSALRVVPVPGTELYEESRTGRFVQLTEREVVEELRNIVGQLKLTNTIFRANHASNVIPIEARLSRDGARLQDELGALIRSGALDASSPGRQPLWL